MCLNGDGTQNKHPCGTTFVPAPTPPPEGEVSEQSDRFKGTDTIDWKGAVLVDAELDLFVSIPIKVDGEVLSDKKRLVFVSFFSTSEEWRYLKCHDVDFLADGKPVPTIGEPDHDGDVREGGVSERVTVSISRDTLSRIAHAKKAEGRLCENEFEFSDGQKAKMLDLLSKAAK
jgi:hypothetical protein